MVFNQFDFEGMRAWLKTIKGSFEIRRARVNIFDRLRYQEQYEELYHFITEMGGKIEGV